MLESTNKNDAFEFLSSEQREIATKIEKLLIGLTITEASELLHSIRKSIKEAKIS